jgi:hypothetical protein
VDARDERGHDKKRQEAWMMRRHGRACPGHPRLCVKKGVDARNKCGHDGREVGTSTGMTISMVFFPLAISARNSV